VFGAKTTHRTVQGVVRPGAPGCGLSVELSWNPEWPASRTAMGSKSDSPPGLFHPPTHSLTHSLTPSLTRSLTRSLTHSLVYALSFFDTAVAAPLCSHPGSVMGCLLPSAAAKTKSILQLVVSSTLTGNTLVKEYTQTSH
jgi:hypothetical protein